MLDRIDIRDYFWQFLCAVSLGLNLGMVALVHEVRQEQSHYIDSEELPSPIIKTA